MKVELSKELTERIVKTEYRLFGYNPQLINHNASLLSILHELNIRLDREEREKENGETIKMLVSQKTVDKFDETYERLTGAMPTSYNISLNHILSKLTDYLNRDSIAGDIHSTPPPEDFQYKIEYGAPEELMKHRQDNIDEKTRHLEKEERLLSLAESLLTILDNITGGKE